MKTDMRSYGKVAMIPPKPNRTEPRDFDRYTYKARHLIENFFAQLKQYRVIATRYDRMARNFLAAIHGDQGGGTVTKITPEHPTRCETRTH